MTFKSFFILLAIGIVLLCGLIFIFRQQNIGKIPSATDETLPPPTPRTAEIPDEIRQKFAKIPEKPTLIAEFKHSNSIDFVAFSPIDPSLVVSTAFDKNYKKSINLWNIDDTSEPIATFTGRSVSFSPDGKLLAISGLSEGVRLWDVNKKKFINTPRLYGNNAVFSPDGRWLALDGISIELWDIRTPTTIKKGPTLTFDGLAENMTFSVDGKLFASAHYVRGEVYIWEIDGNNAVKKVNFTATKGKTGWVETLKFLPDAENPILAIADNYENTKLYNSTDWQVYADIPTGFTKNLTFSPNGKMLVSGGHNEVEFWSMENGERITSIEGYSRWVNSVDISAESNFVASGDGDGFIRIWDVEQYLPSHQIAASDVVIPIYFLPSNLPPQPDIPEKIDKLLIDVQKFFADEMERHGLGRKSFTFEKNEDGSAKIYLFEGRTTDEYYLKNSTRKVTKEIYEHFDPSKNVYLILVDISSKNYKAKRIISAGPERITIDYEKRVRRQQGGDVIMSVDPNGYSSVFVSKMFGDALGLDRDLRDASYLMSYGRKQKQLSKNSAEWLNQSELFNPNQTSFDAHSKIEKLSSLEGKARFNVQDSDGIYQVRLLVIPTDENPPPGYQRKKEPEQNKMDWENKYKGKYYVLYDYLTMNAKKEATVEFDFPKFAKNLIRVQVIDGHGNMVRTYAFLLKVPLIRGFRG